MGWFSILSAVLSIAKFFLDRAARRELISEGESRALLKQYQAGERVLQQAIVARDDTRARLDRDGFLPDDYRD